MTRFGKISAPFASPRLCVFKKTLRKKIHTSTIDPARTRFTIPAA